MNLGKISAKVGSVSLVRNRDRITPFVNVSSLAEILDTEVDSGGFTNDVVWQTFY